MTQRELDYQASLAALFLDKSFLIGAIDETEYLECMDGLRKWHVLASVFPDRAEPLNLEPLYRGLGWCEVAAGQDSNVVPLPMVRP